MKIFNLFKRTPESSSISIITGGQLNYTYKFIERYCTIHQKDDNKMNFLILLNNENENDNKENNEKYYSLYIELSTRLAFNLNVMNIKYNDSDKANIVNLIDKNNYKIKNLLHLNQIEIMNDYTSFDNEHINYDEFKHLIKEYVHEPIQLSSFFLSKNNFDKNAKIFHLALQKPFNLSKIFKPNLLLQNQFSNMNLLYKSMLNKLKIEIGLCNLRTMNDDYIKYLEDYIEIYKAEEVSDTHQLKDKILTYKKFHDKSFDFLCYLMDNDSIKSIASNGKNAFNYIDIINYDKI